MGVVVKRVVIGDTVTDMSPVWWHSDCDCSGESCGGIGLDKKNYWWWYLLLLTSHLCDHTTVLSITYGFKSTTEYSFYNRIIIQCDSQYFSVKRVIEFDYSHYYHRQLEIIRQQELAEKLNNARKFSGRLVTVTKIFVFTATCKEFAFQSLFNSSGHDRPNLQCSLFLMLQMNRNLETWLTWIQMI